MAELKNFFREKNLHTIFEIGVLIKGADGLLEIAGAALLYLINPEKLNRIIILLTQHELSEDPKDYIAVHLLGYWSHLAASARLFQVMYLLSHGVIKIFLVWGLLRNKLWAYPISIGFLLAFIGYQAYRYELTHSLAMLALTIFDILIVGLTWHEYGVIKTYRNPSSATSSDRLQ